MAGRVHRVTMFKLPSVEEQDKLLAAYKVLAQSHKKDGKPYILSLTAGRVMDDPRTQGFTIVSKTEFASLEDMRYYDNDCEAHGALKAVGATLNLEGGRETGLMTVYFEASAST